MIIASFVMRSTTSLIEDILSTLVFTREMTRSTAQAKLIAVGRVSFNVSPNSYKLVSCSLNGTSKRPASIAAKMRP